MLRRWRTCSTTTASCPRSSPPPSGTGDALSPCALAGSCCSCVLWEATLCLLVHACTKGRVWHSWLPKLLKPKALQPSADPAGEDAGGDGPLEEAEPPHEGEDGPHLHGTWLDLPSLLSRACMCLQAPALLRLQGGSEQREAARPAQLLLACMALDMLPWHASESTTGNALTCCTPAAGQPHQEADAGAQLAARGGAAHCAARSPRPARRDPRARPPPHQVRMHVHDRLHHVLPCALMCPKLHWVHRGAVELLVCGLQLARCGLQARHAPVMCNDRFSVAHVNTSLWKACHGPEQSGAASKEQKTALSRLLRGHMFGWQGCASAACMHAAQGPQAQLPQEPEDAGRAGLHAARRGPGAAGGRAQGLPHHLPPVRAQPHG